MSRLDARMVGDGCSAALFEEQHRRALGDACAEDGDIWTIYANNFGPAGFDDSIDFYPVEPAQPHLRAVQRR